MTEAEALRRLTPVITARVPDAPEDIAITDRLEEDLRMNSMAVVELLQDVEDTFRLTVPDESLAGLYTVADLVNIVSSAPRTGERAA